MEELVAELELYLRPGCAIFRLRLCGSNISGKGHVVLDYDALDDCPDIVELDNMLRKRLGAKPTDVNSLDPRTVAKCCIASRGYCVNEETVHGISQKGMLRIWSTLERSKVTSSESLGRWMSLRLGSRSYDGFAKSLSSVGAEDLDRDRSDVPRIHSVTVGSSLNLLGLDAAVGTANTVKGAMVADAKALTAIRVMSGFDAPRFQNLLD